MLVVFISWAMDKLRKMSLMKERVEGPTMDEKKISSSPSSSRPGALIGLKPMSALVISKSVRGEMREEWSSV